MAKNENNNFSYMTRRIGGTTYKVKVVFNDTGHETMEDKILRIVRNEALDNDGKCDIMDVPQMSRQSERSAELWQQNRLKEKSQPYTKGCPVMMN